MQFLAHKYSRINILKKKIIIIIIHSSRAALASKFSSFSNSSEIFKKQWKTYLKHSKMLVCISFIDLYKSNDVFYCICYIRNLRNSTMFFFFLVGQCVWSFFFPSCILEKGISSIDRTQIRTIDMSFLNINIMFLKVYD